MKSARDTIAGEQQPVNNPLMALDQPRFFIQMGWNVLHVDTDAIPNRRLLRGEITPLRSYRAKDNVMSIIPGELIAGTEERDPTGTHIVYGQYWRHALHEAERLVNLETATEFKSGLIELKSLREAAQLYDQFDLTQLIFNNTWPVLPDRNSDVLELLHSQQANLDSRELPGHIKPVLRSTYAEIMDAVIAVDRIQNERLQLTHSKMKLSPLEPGAKHAYDLVDREMLLRTGLPEIYSTDVSIARTLELMRTREAEKPESPGMSELTRALTLLTENAMRQNEVQQRILETLATSSSATGTLSVEKRHK